MILGFCFNILLLVFRFRIFRKGKSGLFFAFGISARVKAACFSLSEFPQG
jgi:hypothetical protein